MKEQLAVEGKDCNESFNSGSENQSSSKSPIFRGFKHVYKILASVSPTVSSTSTPFKRDLEKYRSDSEKMMFQAGQRVVGEAASGASSHHDDTAIEENNSGPPMGCLADTAISSGSSAAASPSGEAATAGASGLVATADPSSSAASGSSRAEPEIVEVAMDDPLDYWVEYEAKFETIMPIVAQDILIIPATSTSSERLFSVSGMLSGGKMSSISPQAGCNLIFL